MHGKHRRLSSQVHHIEECGVQINRDSGERNCFGNDQAPVKCKNSRLHNSLHALVPQTRIAVRLQLIYDTGGIGLDFGKLASVVDAITMVALNPG